MHVHCRAHPRVEEEEACYLGPSLARYPPEVGRALASAPRVEEEVIASGRRLPGPRLQEEVTLWADERGYLLHDVHDLGHVAIVLVKHAQSLNVFVLLGVSEIVHTQTRTQTWTRSGEMHALAWRHMHRARAAVAVLEIAGCKGCTW
jgi:hypothetical protein